MALVVETGAGVAGAVTYVSAADFRSYWSDRGVVFEQTDAVIEASLVQGCDWIDRHEYHGEPATEVQRTAFPRRYCYVRPGNSRLRPGTLLPENEVPTVVVEAQCEATRADLIKPLAEDFDERDLLRAKRVGKIAKEFANPTGRRRLPAVEAKLRGLHREGSTGPSRLILRS